MTKQMCLALACLCVATERGVKYPVFSDRPRCVGRRCVDRIVAFAVLLLSHAKLRAILFTGSLSRVETSTVTWKFCGLELDVLRSFHQTE